MPSGFISFQDPYHTLLSRCGPPGSDPHPGHPGEAGLAAGMAPLHWTGLLLPGQRVGTTASHLSLCLRTPLHGGPGAAPTPHTGESLQLLGRCAPLLRGWELVEESRSRGRSMS